MLISKQPMQHFAYQGLARPIHDSADELGLSVRTLAERLSPPDHRPQNPDRPAAPRPDRVPRLVRGDGMGRPAGDHPLGAAVLTTQRAGDTPSQ